MFTRMPRVVPLSLQLLESCKFEFARTAAQLSKEMKKVDKAETRLRLLTGGFEKRAVASLELLRKTAVEVDEKYVIAGVSSTVVYCRVLSPGLCVSMHLMDKCWLHLDHVCTRCGSRVLQVH
jgi:hypothetical protein